MKYFPRDKQLGIVAQTMHGYGITLHSAGKKSRMLKHTTAPTYRKAMKKAKLIAKKYPKALWHID